MLTERATPNDLARFGRLRCEIAFWDQDEDLAIQWCSFLETLKTSLAFPDWRDPPHPSVNGRHRKTRCARPSKQGLSGSERWCSVIGWRPANRAVALVEIPHFVQFIDKKQLIVES